MTVVSKHFVQFISPGTFVPEITTKEIDSWDVNQACEMAKTIKERHAATPYAFRFITRGREAHDLDSKELTRSNLYYLGGVVRTREEVLAGTDQDEKIVRWNLEFDPDIKRIIVNTNSWKFTGALGDDDVVLEWNQ